MESQEKVLEFLKLNGIPFSYAEHKRVETMADCAALGLPAPHCKNLFLCNRAGTQYYLLLIRADKPFVTREVSRTLGVSRLSFGKDDALLRLLHAHPGCVSPMGLLFPEAGEVRLLCDEDLLQLPAIAFHPLMDTASLWMDTQVFLHNFLPLTGHSLTVLPIASHAEECEHADF